MVPVVSGRSDVGIRSMDLHRAGMYQRNPPCRPFGSVRNAWRCPTRMVPVASVRGHVDERYPLLVMR